MVDEKEEHYEEEGEYHFSDDQVNYDIEPETPKTKSSSGFNKEAVLEKFTQNRRRILGAVSLFLLIGVVYKILVPATTSTPPTEFNQAAAAAKATPAAATVAKVTTTTVSQSVTASAASPSAAQTPAVQSTPPPSVYTQQNQTPVATVTVTSSPAPTSLPPNSAQSLPSTVSSAAGVPPMGMPPATSQTGMPPAMPSPVVVANPMNTGPFDAQTKDRITALEQQNTAMMNLLQTEYAQKIADTETQSNAVRGKMEELTKRVNRMETSLSQITQLLQGMNKSQASGPMGSAPASMYNAASRSSEPRMIYSVQAIIPGRAWLKSESGDTVTVAEGDYLKKYGRVTKIDPYDGVVSIDTGNKVIMLSYGLDGE